MAVNTFIKFDGIEGESVNRDHKNEIDALSWDWGVSNPSAAMGSSTGSGAGVATGRALGSDLHFTHVFDKASPVLAKKCVQGARVATMVLSARKSGEGQKDFLKITLSDVRIVSVSPVAAVGDNIVEAVTLSYAAVEVAYKPQDPTGALGTEVKFTWDLKTSAVS